METQGLDNYGLEAIYTTVGASVGLSKYSNKLIFLYN